MSGDENGLIGPLEEASLESDYLISAPLQF